MNEVVLAILIQTVAGQYGIDPTLALAIVEVESQFNVHATGSAGEIGLMQLKPKFFPTVSYDVQNNLQLGMKHLAEMRRKCGGKFKGDTWVLCYNQGVKGALRIKNPRKHSYVVKVRRAHEKNQWAALRNQGPIRQSRAIANDR